MIYSKEVDNMCVVAKGPKEAAERTEDLQRQLVPHG